MPITTAKGRPDPLGCTKWEEGINFAIFVEDQESETQLIVHNQIEVKQLYSTGKIKHVFIKGLPSSFTYSYKIDQFHLLDPYAVCMDSPHQWNDDKPYLPKAAFCPFKPFDWGEDKPPEIPLENLIIYEMHIRGFSQDVSSHSLYPGSYLGVIDKIPHLKDLGINAVELMPVHEFNPYEYLPPDPEYAGKVKQYWGYSTVNFFTPMNRYAIGEEYDSALREFKQMVRALHESGIEVILDVVFNHTAEGNEEGPIQSFKILGKETYYIPGLDEKYANYSGCGNTFNCNHPIPLQLILSALRYWAAEMHVDGFRFDLASIFYRGTLGDVLASPPILEFISQDPILSKVKLIVEPWDAAGLYQVGSFFPQNLRFSEWNARYRDVIRQFISGKPYLKGEFATRVSGSEDLYGDEGRSPQNSINFISAHDGFTLYDLVCYNFKHNLNNGEKNRDGTNENDSWNCGVEGLTNNQSIIELRLRQMRNFHLALMVSQGIPMLLMGDEYGHTKKGNNNSWCQDNPLNWFLWDELKENKDFYRFYRGLIHFRNQSTHFKNKNFLTPSDIQWHGKTPFKPSWEANDHFLAFTLTSKKEGKNLFIAFNAGPDAAIVDFPPCLPGLSWKWIADTSRALSLDFYDEKALQDIDQTSHLMLPYSSLLLTT